jgi:hypothetical protein
MRKQKIFSSVMVLAMLAFGYNAQASTVHALSDMDPDDYGFRKTGSGFDTKARGWRFTATLDDLWLTELGIAPVTDKSSYTLSLWDFANQSQLAKVTVDYTLADGNWKWASLTTPINLQKDKDYVVMGISNTANAKFYFTNPALTATSPWVPTGAIDYVDTRFCNSCTADTFPASKLAGNHQYGVVDVGYTIGAPNIPEVPLPGAAWMFATGLLVLLKKDEHKVFGGSKSA